MPEAVANRIAPLVDELRAAGMWVSDELRKRLLRLAGEA